MRVLQLRRSADEWWQEQVPRSRGCSQGRWQGTVAGVGGRGWWQGTVAGDGSHCSGSISALQRGTASSGTAGAGSDVQTVQGLLVCIDLPCCWEGNAASLSCFALLITWPLIFIAASLARAQGEPVTQVMYAVGHDSPGMDRLGSPRRG